MNAVYLRLALYVLSSALSMIPAAWAGFVSYDATAQILQISLPGMVAAVAGGIAVSGGIFARWGKK